MNSFQLIINLNILKYHQAIIFLTLLSHPSSVPFSITGQKLTYWGLILFIFYRRAKRRHYFLVFPTLTALSDIFFQTCFYKCLYMILQLAGTQSSATDISILPLEDGSFSSKTGGREGHKGKCDKLLTMNVRFYTTQKILCYITRMVFICCAWAWDSVAVVTCI